MENQTDVSKEIALESIITTAVQIPGVKVSRDKFLDEIFAGEDVNLQDIRANGPVASGISREKLSRVSQKLILKRTSQSSIASFTMGLPGGLAMAATIPADILQFFGMALRLAQEISYLYGSQDLWNNGEIDDGRIKAQLIMYCGVMFGVSGAVSGVRVLSTQIAKTTLKKLPQKALTKTVWYPIVKQIAKAIGIKVTKSAVAKGISKAVPVIGGVISGGLNFASMMPMANRLYSALDAANFEYTDEKLEEDIKIIEAMAVDQPDNSQSEASEAHENDTEDTKPRIENSIKNLGSNISGFFSKKKDSNDTGAEKAENDTDEIIAKIEKLSKLKDAGVITQDDFDEKKAELLSKL